MSTGDAYSKLDALIRTRVLEQAVTIDRAVDDAVMGRISQTVDATLGIDRTWHEIRFKDGALKEVLGLMARKVLDKEENRRRFEQVMQKGVDAVTDKQLLELMRESDYKIRDGLKKMIDASIDRALESHREALDALIAAHISDIISAQNSVIPRRR